MEIKYESYFLEHKKSHQVLELFKCAYDTYVLDKTTKFGLDSDMNKYVKGFELAFYHHGDLIWEPIILNIETGKKTVEYEKMGLHDELSINKYLKNKINPYKVLETFCFSFMMANKLMNFSLTALINILKKDCIIFKHKKKRLLS